MYLSKINTYPIKSTHPISIEAGYLFSTGIGFDRHWMLIDAENNLLELQVDKSVIDQRLSNWKKPSPRYTKGVLAKYAKLAQSASRGAITE